MSPDDWMDALDINLWDTEPEEESKLSSGRSPGNS
jgi:hypothetical protein